MISLVMLALSCGGNDPDPGKKEPAPVDTSTPGTTDTQVTPTPTGLTGTGTGTTAHTGTVPSPLAYTDATPPKHLLMISIDTMRRDALTRYGGAADMPWLDSLLEDSFALDDHLSCSNWTLHATSCAMTGNHPVTMGFLPSVEVTPVQPIPEGIDMLAGWLGDAGFQSVLVTTNNVFSSVMNNATGFHEEYRPPNARFATAEDMGVELRQRLLAMPEDTRRYGHLHLMEPHQPYTPPEEYLDGLDALGEIPYDLTTSDGHNEAVYDLIRGRLSPAAANLTVTHMRMRYRASLRYLDDQLQAVWASLEADGLLDDTLVVVWTDHGEQFMEHGYQAHAWTLYDDEAAAALFFWSENLVAGRHDGPTSGIDMAPTVLASLGVHSMAPMEGLPFDQVPADRPRFLTSWGKAGMFQAVVTPTHKLHFGWTDPDNAPVFAPVGHGVTVFDRAADPLELSGTFDASDPTTQALWGLLLPHIGATLPHTKHVPHWPDGLPTY